MVKTTYHFSNNYSNIDNIQINLSNENQAILIRNAIKDKLGFYKKFAEDDAEMQQKYDDMQEVYQSLVDYQIVSR